MKKYMSCHKGGHITLSATDKGPSGLDTTLWLMKADPILERTTQKPPR